MAVTRPVYMRARCKTGIVASRLTGIAHVPGEFRTCFEGGKVSIRANFLCRSETNRGVVLFSWDEADKVCAVCEDAAKGPSVYYCLNSAQYPVYIGSAVAALKRLEQHRWMSSWWPEVAETRTEHFPNILEARAAEKLAIKSGKPLYNKLHNGYSRRSA